MNLSASKGYNGASNRDFLTGNHGRSSSRGAGYRDNNYGEQATYGADDPLNSPEFNDLTSGLGCADSHIYYIFQN